jgi:hypothetical protein
LYFEFLAPAKKPKEFPPRIPPATLLRGGTQTQKTFQKISRAKANPFPHICFAFARPLCISVFPHFCFCRSTTLRVVALQCAGNARYFAGKKFAQSV